MPKNKYRIVGDMHGGYEVQIKKWWFPFLYFQCDKKGCIGVNTFSNLNQAEKLIEWLKQEKKVIKYID